MQLIVNALIAGSLAALIAGGLSLVYGVMNIFNLALGQMVLMGGYGAWWFQSTLGWPLLPSILGGFAFGAFVSWITFQVAVAPFYKRHRQLPLVTTIAFGMILDAFILLFFEERPRRILSGAERVLSVAGARMSIEQIILVMATILLLAFFAYILHGTSLGRKIRAVVQHDSAAMSLGIRAPTLDLLLFISSGLLAAAGGIFIGIDQNLSPVLAFPLMIKAYAAVIAGGRGNLWGTIVVAYLIALLEQLVVGVHWFGRFYISAGFQSSVALFFIIAFLLFRPMGIFSTQSRTA